MDIYLAGGITCGNLSARWKQLANRGGYEPLLSRQPSVEADGPAAHHRGGIKNEAIHSSSQHHEHRKCPEADMDRGGQETIPKTNQQILESFFYCRSNPWMPKLIPAMRSFLLDSGAFTFMQGSSGAVDWDAYTEEYAAFIRKHDVQLFFELDIDSIVGLKEVERLRAKLEDLTGRKPIPVWHKSRGKDYFIRMCEQYDYVAIGGIVTQEIPRNVYEKAFPWFIKTAHDHGCRIHGLGYTNIQGLHRYHFDSVDSTAWLYGNRGGYLYKFNPKDGTMGKIEAPAGHRLKPQEAALYNFKEWNKFQEYALKYL